MKKRLSVFLISLIILTSLCGCADSADEISVDSTVDSIPANTQSIPDTEVLVTEADTPAAAETVSQEAQAAAPEPFAYPTQYIRTNCNSTYYHPDKFPNSVLIESADALHAYYEANKDIYHNMETPKTDYLIGISFAEACDGYDDAFFESHKLLLVVLSEGSGSIRHQVESLSEDEDTGVWTVTIRQTRPYRTEDMAAWHIILELPISHAITDSASIQIRDIRYGHDS